MKLNCDDCVNYKYDEEYEGYVCTVDMDEDETARIMTSTSRECPYFVNSLYN
ncbi:MAG: DUF6472 family protein [Bacillota bacterium]|nr:DUF6472 family protein [Bacillota bacterium]